MITTPQTPSFNLVRYAPDVDDTLIADGYILKWDDANSKFVFGAESSGLPAGSSGETLYHDGSDWVVNSLFLNNGSQIGVGVAPSSIGFQIVYDNSNWDALKAHNISGRAIQGVTENGYGLVGSIGNAGTGSAILSYINSVNAVDFLECRYNLVPEIRARIAADGSFYSLPLKTQPSHPGAYKSLFVDTSTGQIYSQDVPVGGGGDLLADGTIPLTANWDAGGFKITAQQLESDIVTGTAPFVVASTTVVTNLNADTVDGVEGADINANTTHRGLTNNPHSVTKAQVSLTNVTDEAQIAKSLGTTKGDIIVFTGSAIPAREAIGANDTVLTADSAQASGIKWAAPAGGGAFTALTTVNSDVENTASAIDAVKITIPADDWADGETIFMMFRITTLQNSGASISLREIFKYGSQDLFNEAANVSSSTFEGSSSRYFIATRVGSTIWYSTQSLTSEAFTGFRIQDKIPNDYYSLDNSSVRQGRRTVQVFNSQKDLVLNLQWGSANANAYVRIEQSHAYKIGGTV